MRLNSIADVAHFWKTATNPTVTIVKGKIWVEDRPNERTLRCGPSINDELMGKILTKFVEMTEER